MTANTVERWDEAALRKGRVDINYEFKEKAFKKVYKVSIPRSEIKRGKPLPYPFEEDED